MKKYLVIILITIFTVLPALSAQDGVYNVEDLMVAPTQFFETPKEETPEIRLKDGSKTKPLTGMPLFKKTRIKITNYFREKNYKQRKKEIEIERKAELEAQKALEEELKDELDVVEEETAQEEVAAGEVIEPKKEKKKKVELVGGISQQVSPKEAQLDADNIDFDEKTMEIIATGSPVLIFPPQKAVIKADKMIYNNASNKLKAFGNVEVTKNGTVTTGDYLQINMNEENAFMDNTTSKFSYMKLTSRTSEMDGDKVTLYNGELVSDHSYILFLETQMIGNNHFNKMLISDDDRSNLFDPNGDTKVRIKSKEVIIDAKKNTDTITFKKSEIHYGDHHLFNWNSFTAHTNKNNEYFEANYPEIGAQGRMGMFAGPGYTFDTPLQHGSTLKIAPMLNYKDGFGFGGMLKYRSGTNYSYVMYGSAADMVIARGRQELDDKLFLQYGTNAYMDEWFLGHRMAKYNVELAYDDKGMIYSTLGEGKHLSLRHRASIGYMHDSQYNSYGEHIKTKNIGTLRARYMAEAIQTLYNYEDPEKLRLFNFALVFQGSAAVYGTGDTQFIGRIAPRIRTQYKYWLQDIFYYLSTYDDNTPMARYDKYRYGRGSLHIRETFRLNKYLSLSWLGTFNVTNDAPSDKFFQECSFVFGIGPDDFKINLGYDWIRQQTYAGVVIALDTKGSGVEFEKMIIKHPENLNKSNEEVVALKVFDNLDAQPADPFAPKKPKPKKKMMYAEVTDIEDPDREQI